MLPLLSTVISDILDVSEEAGQLYLPSPHCPLKFENIILTELWGRSVKLQNSLLSGGFKMLQQSRYYQGRVKQHSPRLINNI